MCRPWGIPQSRSWSRRGKVASPRPGANGSARSGSGPLLRPMESCGWLGSLERSASSWLRRDACKGRQIRFLVKRYFGSSARGILVSTNFYQGIDRGTAGVAAAVRGLLISPEHRCMGSALRRRERGTTQLRRSQAIFDLRALETEGAEFPLPDMEDLD
jgi:hypothetical protein